jgi:hypothetical protein
LQVREAISAARVGERKAMVLAQVKQRRADNGPDARAARRALRAEKAQLLRWRRLLRARLDLAVASYAPPDTLGAMSWDILPDAQLSLPRPQELLAVVRVSPAQDQVALMQRLRALDRQLADYQAHLDAALEESTQQIMGTFAAPDRKPDAR